MIEDADKATENLLSLLSSTWHVFARKGIINGTKP